jgi:poly [ADP-ribose] polymerase
MAKVTEVKKFVKSDAEANNNKVWQYTVYDDNTMEIEYGRIGCSLQSDGVVSYDRSKLDKKVKEKTQPWNGKKGGYVAIDVLAAPTGPSGPTGSSTHVKTAAIRDIAGADPVLAPLITRLAEANKHEIQLASGGQMDIDLSTGVISTPVGVVSKANVDQARIILGTKLEPFVKKADFDNTDFKRALSDYLMLVPQRVGHRNWHASFLPDIAAMTRQVSLLDQLDASIELVEQRLSVAAAAPVDQPQAPARSFDVRLELMGDKDKDWLDIVKMYHDGKNDNHSSKHLVPIRGFRLTIPHMKAAWDLDGAKLDNQWRLWHGSRIFNLLSIMKRGFVMPQQLPTAVIAGAMFGSGLYFSDQSTKSLNYSYGYWQGGGGYDNNCFMFVVDVAMGKYHVPSSPRNTPPPAGYDSTFAKGKQSGVLNNEMIVFRLGQANITHLIEFGPGK